MLKTAYQKSKLLTTEGRMALYNSLGRNMSVYKVQLDDLSEVIHENPKDHYILLFRNISFIALDLCAALRACLNSQNLYERRYHIKYILVNCYEAFQAVYNHCGDKYSYVNKLEQFDKHLKADRCYLDVVSRLKSLRSRFNDISEARNSYVHYDENILKTYEYILEIDSEKSPVQLCCDVLEVFQLIKILCESNTELQIGEIWIPHVDDLENVILKSIFTKLSTDKCLEDTLTETISNTPIDIDKDVRILKVLNLFSQNIACDVSCLFNMHILIQFIRVDLAVALRAFLQSADSVEGMLNLRRLEIIKQEGVLRLQSMWNKLPSSLKNDLAGEQIIPIMDNVKRQARHHAVHYRFGKDDYVNELYKDCNNMKEQLKLLQEIPTLLNSLTLLHNTLTDKIIIARRYVKC